MVHEVQPDECYHLAAQSFVSYSFDDEFSTLNANINGRRAPKSWRSSIIGSCYAHQMGGRTADCGRGQSRENCPFRRSRYCSLQCDGAPDRKRVEDRWNGQLTAILGQFQTALTINLVAPTKRVLPVVEVARKA